MSWVNAVVQGVFLGGLYALFACGLSLMFGVMRIINLAHGDLAVLGAFAVWEVATTTHLSPFLALIPVLPVMLILGYVLHRTLLARSLRGGVLTPLLTTFGLAIVIENALLYAFRADTRTINLPYGFSVIEVGPAFLSVPRVIGFCVVIAVAAALYLLMRFTDTGKAIRAVAKEKLGAELSGIDVAHVYAVTFGLGTACLAVAACLLLPTYYVNPHAGNAFVLIAFTIVVLGGMGSVAGALLGGLIIGVVESLCGLYLGESLGQIGIFVIFILVLLFRPTGLFGERA